MMPVLPEGNHAAIAAWIQGGMREAERLEFEAHLATCVDCQAEVAAFRREQAEQHATTVVVTKRKAATPAPRKSARGLWSLLVVGVLLLIAVGYALGLWLWQLAHQ